MLHGLVDACKAFGEPAFLERALKNISFIESHLIINGKIHRAYKNKPSETEGFLEDYSFLIQAYTSLYQATFNETWLRKAEQWTNYTIGHFYDASEGYFNFHPARQKSSSPKRKRSLTM